MDEFDSLDANVAHALPRKRGRLRQACNSCSRAKKKCDGGHPCSFCEKGGLQCMYEARNRPGPPPKRTVLINGTFRGKECGGSSDSDENQQQQQLFCEEIKLGPATFEKFALESVHLQGLNYISLFSQSINSNIPIFDSNIFSDGINLISSIREGCIDPTSNEISMEKYRMFRTLSVDDCAKISLTWAGCAFGAFIMNDSRYVVYLLACHSSLQYCFSGSSAIVARAFLVLELLLNVTFESLKAQPEDLEYNVPLTYLISKRGVFYSLGDSIISFYNINDSTCNLLLELVNLNTNISVKFINEFANFSRAKNGIAVTTQQRTMERYAIMSRFVRKLNNHSDYWQQIMNNNEERNRSDSTSLTVSQVVAHSHKVLRLWIEYFTDVSVMSTIAERPSSSNVSIKSEVESTRHSSGRNLRRSTYTSSSHDSDEDGSSNTRRKRGQTTNSALKFAKVGVGRKSVAVMESVAVCEKSVGICESVATDDRDWISSIAIVEPLYELPFANNINGNHHNHSNHVNSGQNSQHSSKMSPPSKTCQVPCNEASFFEDLNIGFNEDLRCLRFLEESGIQQNDDPLTYFILHMSINLFRVSMGKIMPAFASFRSVSSFLVQNPMILSIPSIWLLAYILNSMLSNYCMVHERYLDNTRKTRSNSNLNNNNNYNTNNSQSQTIANQLEQNKRLLKTLNMLLKQSSLKFGINVSLFNEVANNNNNNNAMDCNVLQYLKISISEVIVASSKHYNTNNTNNNNNNNNNNNEVDVFNNNTNNNQINTNNNNNLSNSSVYRTSPMTPTANINNTNVTNNINTNLNGFSNPKRFSTAIIPDDCTSHSDSGNSSDSNDLDEPNNNNNSNNNNALNVNNTANVDNNSSNWTANTTLTTINNNNNNDNTAIINNSANINNIGLLNSIDNVNGMTPSILSPLGTSKKVFMHSMSTSSTSSSFMPSLNTSSRPNLMISTAMELSSHINNNNNNTNVIIGSSIGNGGSSLPPSSASNNSDSWIDTLSIWFNVCDNNIINNNNNLGIIDHAHIQGVLGGH